MSDSTASPARPFALASSIFPSWTNVISIALVSNGAI